jgi:hypothetical protein
LWFLILILGIPEDDDLIFINIIYRCFFHIYLFNSPESRNLIPRKICEKHLIKKYIF